MTFHAERTSWGAGGACCSNEAAPTASPAALEDGAPNGRSRAGLCRPIGSPMPERARPAAVAGCPPAVPLVQAPAWACHRERRRATWATSYQARRHRSVEDAADCGPCELCDQYRRRGFGPRVCLARRRSGGHGPQGSAGAPPLRVTACGVTTPHEWGRPGSNRNWRSPTRRLETAFLWRSSICVICTDGSSAHLLSFGAKLL